MGATGRSNEGITDTATISDTLFQSLMGATGRSNGGPPGPLPGGPLPFQSLMGATGRSNSLYFCSGNPAGACFNPSWVPPAGLIMGQQCPKEKS